MTTNREPIAPIANARPNLNVLGSIEEPIRTREKGLPKWGRLLGVAVEGAPAFWVAPAVEAAVTVSGWLDPLVSGGTDDAFDAFGADPFDCSLGSNSSSSSVVMFDP
jgi:hypothetical protein